MSRGYVLHDDETVGHYKTLYDGAITIMFENDKNGRAILELARETGASLMLLQNPEITEQEAT